PKDASGASMVAPEPQYFSPPQHVITPDELKPAPLIMDSVTSAAVHAPTPLPQVAQQGEVALPPPPVPRTQNEPYFYPPPTRRPRPWLVVMLLLALLMFIGSGLVWYW